MAPPREFPSVEAAALADRPLHLAIGMFDGVHLGHQAVIDAAVHAARVSDGTAAVLTFRPHPSRLFRPQQPTRLIFDGRSQAERLGRLGVDAVITHPFEPAFAAIPAEEFLGWLTARLPTLKSVYVGQNWRYGAGRRGNVATLVESGRGCGVSVFSAPAVHWDGETVTSTRIRALLEEGRIGVANALLGSPYSATAKVAPGRRLGRQLGFPTLNLPWDQELRPRFGVYRMRVRRAEDERTAAALPAIANYGLRPTVERTDRPLLEVHLLGACPFGEGDRLSAEWLDFVRPELKFASVEELKAQIARDVAAAR